jgi:S1-C subfamily serine protease
VPGPFDIRGVLERAAIPSDRTVGILYSVQGDPPQDLGGHPADGPGDDGTNEDGPIRGWVSPDDRLWLHPSERAQGGPSTELTPVPDRLAGGRWVAGGMAACLALTILAVVMVLTTTDDALNPSAPAMPLESGVPTTEVGLSQLIDMRRMTALATSAHDSTVALLVDRGSSTSMGTGVVAEAGGIIVTLQPVVVGARSITVVEPDGTRLAAVFVGTDTTTGIAVLRIADELTAAEFTEGDPATGAMVVAMAMEPRSSSHLDPIARLYAGTVKYAGIATGTWQGTGLCVTGVAAPMLATELGSPLIDSSGNITGILDAVVGSGSQRTSVFLPAHLVHEVVAQIVNHGSVIHSDLGLSATEAPTVSGVGSGARVQSVTSDSSAAQAGLQSGDVVIGIDGQTVDSAAELSTRIYAEPPGTELRFTVERGGVKIHPLVILAQG